MLSPNTCPYKVIVVNFITIVNIYFSLVELTIRLNYISISLSILETNKCLTEFMLPDLSSTKQTTRCLDLSNENVG